MYWPILLDLRPGKLHWLNGWGKPQWFHGRGRYPGTIFLTENNWQVLTTKIWLLNCLGTCIFRLTCVAASILLPWRSDFQNLSFSEHLVKPSPYRGNTSWWMVMRSVSRDHSRYKIQGRSTHMLVHLVGMACWTLVAKSTEETTPAVLVPEGISVEIHSPIVYFCYTHLDQCHDTSQ